MGKILLVLTLIVVCQLCIKVDAQTKYVNGSCGGTEAFSYTKGSVYESNLNLLLSNLTSKASSLKFYNSTVGVASNKVYGLFQCRNDISLDDCSSCVKEVAKKIIEKCPLFGEAIVWYYECKLRYANRNIFSLFETLPSYTPYTTGNVSDYDKFAPILASSMKDLIKKTSSALPYYGSSVTNFTLFEILYSFAECTSDLNSFGCDSCLKSALSRMGQCCGKSMKIAVFMPSCELRFDMSPFLIDHQSSSTPSPTTNQGSGTGTKTSSKTTIIGAIAGCVSVGLLVLAVVLWLCLCRNKTDKVRTDVPRASTSWLPEGTVKSDEEGLGDTDFEQYDFVTLKIATIDFSDENKLGEGGFGSVYKGTLENGEKLAIKRLSGTGGQGIKEFMAEARLLAKLQHRNLVKLLGFCSEGDEKLLVYEFMSNASLDGFLFDERKRPLLDWAIRYKIIMGIARGLQYLHEDSRLTIIHRDLKPANILLDKEMNPKIADFGLAKLFGGAQKLGNTLRIVGTQGYMAPEYMMTGEYSDKTDVYSFGIMLLEIVSGQRNRKFQQSPPQREDLSIQAWKLWNEERSFEITDPILINECSSKEVMRCIQIGLLCLQANADQRPTMTAVVLMLTGNVDLPLPLAPAMPSNQYNIPMAYSGAQHSDVNSTKSIGQDLYPLPR